MVSTGGRAAMLALALSGLVLFTAAGRAQETGPPLPASAIPVPLPPGSNQVPAAALGAKPDGLWLMDDDVVLDIYHCGLMVCGRIVWMRKPRDAAGHPVIDNHNPNPALRSRLLCNVTIIDGLRPDGPDAWKDGHVYDPRTGSTYDVDAKYDPDGTVHARIYQGISLLGETKTLVRVPRGHTDGWC